MVEHLIADLLSFPEVGQIIFTCNVPEQLLLPTDKRIMHIQNDRPAGFAANHNQAFQYCKLPFFCPVNPDVRLSTNPFPPLLDAMRSTRAAICAPSVYNSAGELEDNFRTFPTFRSLCAKALGLSDGRYPINNQALFYPDWVAGMFMLIEQTAFHQLGGFDSRYFLYYEDVDICARAWQAGMTVLACPRVGVIHDAQRASRRHFNHLLWHVSSLIRYLFKFFGKSPNVQRKLS